MADAAPNASPVVPLAIVGVLGYLAWRTFNDKTVAPQRVHTRSRSNACPFRARAQHARASEIIVNRDLNKLVVQKALALPHGYEVSGDAPDTYERLLTDTTRNGGRLTVYSGASDNTIYGEPSVNHAMRAWHDATHLIMGRDFTLASERAVGLEQARQATDPQTRRLIIADVVGQAEYYDRHGRFPDDQVAFVAAYMKDREGALRKRY